MVYLIKLRFMPISIEGLPVKTEFMPISIEGLPVKTEMYAHLYTWCTT